MSSDNVVEFPGAQEEETQRVEIPEATMNAMRDPGWVAAAMLVTEIGGQVMGDDAMILAIPDPEGFHQKQSGKPGDRVGIYVDIKSTEMPGLGATLVVPFEVEAINQIRYVFAEMSVKLRNAVMQQMAAEHPTLLVPEKKLIIPGQDV